MWIERAPGIYEGIPDLPVPEEPVPEKPWIEISPDILQTVGGAILTKAANEGVSFDELTRNMSER